MLQSEIEANRRVRPTETQLEENARMMAHNWKAEASQAQARYDEVLQRAHRVNEMAQSNFSALQRAQTEMEAMRNAQVRVLRGGSISCRSGERISYPSAKSGWCAFDQRGWQSYLRAAKKLQ